jgi:glutaminase
MDFPSIAEPLERPYVSTGHLPEPEMVQKLVSDAHRRFNSNGDGQNSQVYPALAEIPAELFGISVAGTSGHLDEAGDTASEFSIMSVSKPFVFALVGETIGPERRRRITATAVSPGCCRATTGRITCRAKFRAMRRRVTG